MDRRMRSNKPSLSPLSVLAIIGFCGYIFWELLGIFGNLTFAARFLPKESAQSLGIFEFFILAAAFMVAGKLHQKLEQRFKKIIGVGVASTSVTLLVSLAAYIAPNNSLHAIFWIILWGSHGLSLASLMFAWVLFFSKFFSGSTSWILSIGYTLGYSLFCLYSLANPNDSGAMTLLIAAIAVALTITLLISCNTSSIDSEDADFLFKQDEDISSNFSANDTSDRMARKLNSSKLPRTFYAISFGLCFGFAIYLVNYLGGIATTLGALGGLSGCVLALILLPKDILTSDTATRRLSFIPVAMPLLLLPTGGLITCIICCMFIIASSTFTAITSWISTVSKSDSEKRAIELFSQNKWPGWLGFFLGMTIGRLVVLGDLKVFTTSIALLAILVCVGFAWYELGTFDNKLKTRSGHDDVKENPSQDCFSSFCKEIAATNKLTPRETEVLYLLAKGYNADSISKELSIAKPTTKTHIQHIYQKLSINSQQALIALINDRY